MDHLQKSKLYYNLIVAVAVFIGSAFLLLLIHVYSDNSLTQKNKTEFYQDKNIYEAKPKKENLISSNHSIYVIYGAIGTSLVGLFLLSYLLIHLRKEQGKYKLSHSEAIVNQKNNNKNVLESEQNYREIFNSTNEAIFIHDAKTGKLLDVNDITLNMFGYQDKSEILACTIGDLSLNEPPYTNIEALQYVAKALTEGPQIIEWRSKKKNGKTFWTEVTLRKAKISGKDKILVITKNISDRKKVEFDLQESEKRYKTLIETSQDGISLMDLNGVMLYINQRKVEMVGAESVDQMIGTSAFNLLTEESKTTIYNLMPEIIQNGYLNNIIARVMRVDGTVFSAEFNVTVLNDENGNPEYLMDTMRDITEREHAITALKESEEKYRNLMDNMNEVLMMVDNDDMVLYVNKKFTEKLGYEPEEIIGKIGYQLLLDKEDQQIILNANRERLHKKISQYETKFTAKNGKKIDFLISGAPIYNSEGKTIGSIGSMTDITDRIIAEKALKESEQRYKTVIEAIPDIIMISDLKGNIIFGNEALERITGITTADYGNLNRKAKIHPDDLSYVLKEKNELLQSDKKQTAVIDNRFIDVWGKTHWFRGIISKILLNDELVLQTISRDITSQKIIEEELENYRNHLEYLVKLRTDELEATNEELISNLEELHAQREELETTLDKLQKAQNQLVQSEKMASLGILAAGVAHEINNPLNFISAGIGGIENYFAQHLSEHISAISPIINGMQEGVNRSAAIVDSLSHYSRREDMPFTDFDLHLVLDNCLIMLNNQLKHKIEIIKNYSEKPALIFGNEGKLHQAVLNVVANSVHAIEEKGIIAISTSVEDKKVILEIEDNGSGIKKEFLPKIMDPFFTTKEPGKGTGLGLSITYNILHEHNGSIEYQSLENKGTLAIITLPLKK